MAAFKHFVKLIKTQFNSGIKAIQFDNGSEYKRIDQMYKNSGIVTQMSCPHTSAQNGRAERKHRHVVEMGLTLLAQA